MRLRHSIDPNEFHPRGAPRDLGPRRGPDYRFRSPEGKVRSSEIATSPCFRAEARSAIPESTVISWAATIFTGRRVTDVRMQLVRIARISIRYARALGA